MSSIEKTGRRYTRSSSLKMALLFTLLLGISTAILVYFIHSFGQSSFIRETEAAIDADIASLREWYERSGEAEMIATLTRRNQTSNLYLLLDNNEKKLAGSLPGLPAEASRLKEGIIEFEYNGRRFAAKIDTFANGHRLLMARDIEDLRGFYVRLQWLSGLIIMLMAMVVATSYLISVFVVSRTNMIARTAQQIMDTGDLSRRISIHNAWDDLSNMAQVLNALLARIEHLMQGVARVSDNIAHDLRTPLTRLRHKLEKRDDPELVAEADHLLATFAALLRITNLETGKRHAVLQPVALDTVLRDVIELYEPLAEEKQITLTVTLSSLFIQGDKDLLFQMFANLIDNALKFTPHGGKVSVTLNETAVVIADSGIGIQETEQARVFERFYRSDASRTTSGNGLGLSLVAAIADIHRIRIKLKNLYPGLEIRVEFAE